MDDLANMDLDDLRAMLIAKDEMVKQLEAQIKEMKMDAESKISSENALEEHDKDKEEKMGEDEDKEKKMAEDKKDHYKMRETVSAELLSEFNALREKNEQMAKRLETIEREKREIEKREAVSALLRDGRIEPSQESVAGKAWELREIQPEFWQMFSERPAGAAVPLQEVGHGASGREINRQSLNAEIKKLAAEKSISYSEALNQFRTSNPDFYIKAYGG
jgi:chromosome segregation ATPase